MTSLNGRWFVTPASGAVAAITHEASWATTSLCPVVAADGKVREMATCDVRTYEAKS